MIDLPFGHFVLVGLVALLVIGPKDLPKAMRLAGYWVGRARGVARQFRSGFDEMVREAELAEMEKKWKAENERIMREHPAPAPDAVEADAATPVMVERPAMIDAPTAASAIEPDRAPPTPPAA